MTAIQIALQILTWLLIVMVVLPFVRSDYWIFRILEYPRYQKFIFCCIVLLAGFIVFDYSDNFQMAGLGGLFLSSAYLAYKIWPYTPLARREMKSVKTDNQANQLKLLAANVLQDNRNYEVLINQIRANNPDVVMLVETDQQWEKAVDVIIKDYPHCLKEPLDNTYGLLLYSKLQIQEGSIKYLVENDVPSAELTVLLPSGQPVKIWGLHPKPPVPGEDSHSTAKDKELMKVALKTQKTDLPVIVMGDLNDVAWSHVTELFRKTSELLDPRRGRGFYSTFSANYWFMRFPLDYIFCSSDFGLIRMKRLPKNGSDHFPMFIHLEFQPHLEKQQETPSADQSEKEEAIEKASTKVD